MLRITVRNDESAKEARMIKSKVESNMGKWSMNKYDKGKQLKSRPAQLTRTQKRKLQRKRSIRRMKDAAVMLDLWK